MAPKKTAPAPAPAAAKAAPAKAAAAKPAAAPAKPAAAAKPAKTSTSAAHTGKGYFHFVFSLYLGYYSCIQILYNVKIAKKHVQKGKHLNRDRRIHTTVRFRRPVTLSLPRKPRYQRKSVPHRNR